MHLHNTPVPGIDTNDPGKFDIDGVTGKATFTGNVFDAGDLNATGSFEFFYVKNDNGLPKKELKSAAYDPVPPGGGVDPKTWRFFDFDPN